MTKFISKKSIFRTLIIATILASAGTIVAVRNDDATGINI